MKIIYIILLDLLLVSCASPKKDVYLKGYLKGKETGYEKGYKDGYKEGYKDGDTACNKFFLHP